MCHICDSYEKIDKVSIAIGDIPNYCPSCGKGIRTGHLRPQQKIYFVPDLITVEDCYVETVVFHSKENITAPNSLLYEHPDMDNLTDDDSFDVYEAMLIGKIGIKKTATLIPDFD